MYIRRFFRRTLYLNELQYYQPFPTFFIRYFYLCHSIGMCGLIVVAIPLKKHNLDLKIIGAVLYNSGRVFTSARLIVRLKKIFTDR